MIATSKWVLHHIGVASIAYSYACAANTFQMSVSTIIWLAWIWAAGGSIQPIGQGIDECILVSGIW